MSFAYWTEQAHFLVLLCVAAVLGAAIGAERQFRSKDAGLRTHALVALGTATFMVVSKFGFNDLVGTPGISVDPTRVAAQVVSGIGFLGGGLIFVRRDSVRGLTTASSVWLAAAVGMAAGSGLFVVALAATGLHYLVVTLLATIGQLMPQSGRFTSVVRIVYPSRQGALREILESLTATGWSITNFGVQHSEPPEPNESVTVNLEVGGRGSHLDLIQRLEPLGASLKIGFHPDDV